MYFHKRGRPTHCINIQKFVLLVGHRYIVKCLPRRRSEERRAELVRSRSPSLNGRCDSI
jgi:hypothetical protein